MQVINKRQGMALWRAGAFGNRLRSWPTLAEYMADSYDGRIGLRYLDPRGGGTPWEAHVPKEDVPRRVSERSKEGLLEKYTLFCEEAPDHKLICNGEYHAVYGFFMSRVHKPMRYALREGGVHVSVPHARLLLQHVMTPSSWSDLRALEDLYPEHVVELSVYDLCLGQCPGRNTIIWEVRKY